MKQKSASTPRFRFLYLAAGDQAHTSKQSAWSEIIFARKTYPTYKPAQKEIVLVRGLSLALPEKAT
jgi:hypothetical protein